ncbi:MAG TPA: endonuclease domain-containing protein [Vicingus sp.]|nr:endonuclease domain-containing protein [Vicingus sp.]
MKIYYNQNLKLLARNHRNDSTKSEIILWQELKGKKILGYKFLRQKPIGNYIVDFFCNKLKLAKELDGYTHQFDDVIVKDEKKELYLNSIGITVLRFNDNDVINDMNNVLRGIESYILVFEKINTKNL